MARTLTATPVTITVPLVPPYTPSATAIPGRGNVLSAKAA